MSELMNMVKSLEQRMESQQQTFFASNNQPSFQQDFSSQQHRGRGRGYSGHPTVVLRAEMPVVDMPIVIWIIVIRVVSWVVASGAVAVVALTAVVPAGVAAPMEGASL